MAREEIRTVADVGRAIEELKKHIDAMDESVPNHEAITAEDWAQIVQLVKELSTLVIEIATAGGVIWHARESGQ